MARAKKTQPPRQRRVAFVVSFVLPEGARIADARAYVVDAIASMSGGLQPPGYGPGGPDPEESGDPMFDLDGPTVRVTYVRPADRKRGAHR